MAVVVQAVEGGGVGVGPVGFGGEGGEVGVGAGEVIEGEGGERWGGFRVVVVVRRFWRGGVACERRGGHGC